MNTNNAGPQLQIGGRSRPFRSLLVATAAALVLAGFIVPRANARVLVYFNFENATLGGAPDFASDQTPAFGGDNPGGGIQASTLTTNLNANTFQSNTGLELLTPNNVTAGDNDTIANGSPNLGLGMERCTGNNGHWIQFAVNATVFSNMTLSFAFNNPTGNGFGSVDFSYSIDGGTTFTAAGSALTPKGVGVVSFAVPAGADNQPGLVLRLTFQNGFSNGNDPQTIIDNIVLGGTAVPEAATVWGGLLGVCGLCWHQRRQLIRCLPLRRA